MARAHSTDFLQDFRYHVLADLEDGGEIDPLQILADPSGKDGKGEAGFSNVSGPELTLESSEYRDGITIYTRKQPGIPSVNDITLQRGMARKDTVFYDWILRCLRGDAYRATLYIYQWGQDAAPGRNPNLGKGNPYDISQARLVKVHEAFPIRAKVVPDFDATSSEISLMEVDIAYEWFEVDPQLQDA